MAFSNRVLDLNSDSDHNRAMSKSKKAILAGVILFLLLVVASPFIYKGYRRLSISNEVEKINSCLNSGGCLNPETMACGPYTPDDPNVMCDQKKTDN